MSDSAKAIANSRDDIWVLCAVLVLRAARDPDSATLVALHQELARAELAGEISEFYVLGLQAILASAELTDLASEYLDMARLVALVAEAPEKQEQIKEWKAICDWLRFARPPSSECCQAVLRDMVAIKSDWSALLRRICSTENVVRGQHDAIRAA